MIPLPYFIHDWLAVAKRAGRNRILYRDSTGTTNFFALKVRHLDENLDFYSQQFACQSYWVPALCVRCGVCGLDKVRL